MKRKFGPAKELCLPVEVWQYIGNYVHNPKDCINLSWTCSNALLAFDDRYWQKLLKLHVEDATWFEFLTWKQNAILRSFAGCQLCGKKRIRKVYPFGVRICEECLRANTFPASSAPVSTQGLVICKSHIGKVKTIQVCWRGDIDKRCVEELGYTLKEYIEREEAEAKAAEAAAAEARAAELAAAQARAAAWRAKELCIKIKLEADLLTIREILTSRVEALWNEGHPMREQIPLDQIAPFISLWQQRRPLNPSPLSLSSLSEPYLKDYVTDIIEAIEKANQWVEKQKPSSSTSMKRSASFILNASLRKKFKTDGGQWLCYCGNHGSPTCSDHSCRHHCEDETCPRHRCGLVRQSITKQPPLSQPVCQPFNQAANEPASQPSSSTSI